MTPLSLKYLPAVLFACCLIGGTGLSSVCFAQTVESEDDTQEVHEDEASGEQHLADDDAHDEAHDDAEHEEGVPLSFQSDLALWTLITFLVFLYVVKKLAWKPLITGLDKREAGIRQAVADAEENHRKSQALLADYEQKLREAEQTVAGMVAEAKRDAERTSQNILAETQSEVEAQRARARDEIERAKNVALADVFSSVNQQVALATERVLGRSLSDHDQERLIQEALSEISGQDGVEAS